MQTIDDLLPQDIDHDQFIIDLVNVMPRRIANHYQRFHDDLSANTNPHDVQPQIAFHLDNHQLRIQYTPYDDVQSREKSVKITQFDNHDCNVDLYQH